VIGYGAPNAGGGDVHGSPLGNDNVKKVKELFGFDPNASFVVPPEVSHCLDDHWGKAVTSTVSSGQDHSIFGLITAGRVLLYGH